MNGALSPLFDRLSRIVVGKETVLERITATLLSSGHVLLEDVPGTGKTVMARAFARSLDLSFSRIQCTPDLMPSDLTGSMIFDRSTSSFTFRPGPLFAQIVLVDELNRASPRTQSALLEAMAEGQVTVDGVTRTLPDPFMVLATQNPLEFEGTFPLAEAQRDRFLMKLGIGYPEEEEELAILRRFDRESPSWDLAPSLGAADVRELRTRAQEVHVEEDLYRYIAGLSRATREHVEVRAGSSPRGSLALLHAAKAHAFVEGRSYLIPDDVKTLVTPVLAHRIVLTEEALLRGTRTEDLLDEVIRSVPAPTESRP